MSGGMKGVNQLPLEVSRQKKKSLLLEAPHMIFLKALTLILEYHLQHMKELLAN